MILNNFHEGLVNKLYEVFPEVRKKGGVQIIFGEQNADFFSFSKLPGITIVFGDLEYKPERTLDPIVIKDKEAYRGESQQWFPYDYPFSVGLHHYEINAMNDAHERLLSEIGPYNVITAEHDGEIFKFGVDLRDQRSGGRKGSFFRIFDYITWLMLKGHVKPGYLVKNYEILLYQGVTGVSEVTEVPEGYVGPLWS